MAHTALYSTAGLRSSLREALNYVDRGTEVYVRRHGVNYQLVKAEDLEHFPNDIESKGDISYVGTNADPNLFEGTKDDNPFVPEHRTEASIINEINFAEVRRDDALEYCQDPDEAKKIKLKWDTEIQKLWNEYHEMKGTRVS